MTFTTKKTRVFSAFAAILMLLSLMTCFVLPVGAEGAETYTIYRALYMAGKKVMDLPAIEEVAANSEVAAGTLELSGYVLADKSQLNELPDGRYIMPAKDITLIYNNTVVDLDPLDAVLTTLNPYDRALFTADPVAPIEEFLAELAANGVADGMAADALQATPYGSLAALNSEIAVMVEAADLSKLVLKNAAPYLPKYAEKDRYTRFSAVGGKVSSYMIADAADWFAVLRDGQLKNMDFAGVSLYLKNNVDLKGFEELIDLKRILPVFAGVLDGRGYAFENVVINEAVVDAPIALIGTLRGTVKNLGIASGSVTSSYRATDNSYGIAALVGKAEAGAKLLKVWNAANVTVSGAYEETEGVTKSDYPVAGIVGIAEAGVVINGCYNLGVITGGEKVAELANGSASVTNGFASGKNSLVEAATIANVLPYNTAEDAYAFAYKLNAGCVPTEGAVYFTVDENGKPALVYDNDDKAVVKVTVDATPDKATAFEFDYSFFAKAGDKVLLDASYAKPETYAIKTGSGLIVKEGGLVYLELGQSDVVVTVEISPLNSDALIEALNYYNNKDAAAFEDADVLGAALARARKNNYPNAQKMAEDVAILNANVGKYTTTHPETLPSVSEMANYPDAVAFGYTIRSKEELKAVAAAPAVNYGKLYLATDLDLTGETFDGLKNLTVAFDGLGNTITGWLDADGGFFENFAGGSIANITFIGAKTENGAILMNEAAAAVELKNVHVKDALIQAAEADDLAFLIGKTAAKVTVTESSVLGSLMLNAGYAKNHGILVGAGTEVVLKNVVATGNTIQNVELGAGAGLLIASAVDVVAENVAATFNTINVKANDAKGMALISTDADAEVKSIYAEGNQVTYDGLGEGGAIALLNLGNPAMATVYADAKTAIDALNAAAVEGYAAWTLDATFKAPTLVIDGRAPSYTVTFKVGELTVAVYPTDEFGHLFDYKKSDAISKYTWTEISDLATYVFTADVTLVAEAAVDHMNVEVVGAATADAPANVQVLFNQNPGLRAVTFRVTFDNTNFELVNVAGGGLFSAFESYDATSDPNATGSFKVTVWDTAIVGGDGVALKMSLKALNGAGDYADAVTVEVVEAYDGSYNPVAIDAETLDISVARGILWGDVTNDDVVDSADVAMLLQYIVGKIDSVNNAAAGELDGVRGLSVVDAQIIFSALANNTADAIKPVV